MDISVALPNPVQTTAPSTLNIGTSEALDSEDETSNVHNSSPPLEILGSLNGADTVSTIANPTTGNSLDIQNGETSTYVDTVSPSAGSDVDNTDKKHSYTEEQDPSEDMPELERMDQNTKELNDHNDADSETSLPDILSASANAEAQRENVEESVSEKQESRRSPESVSGKEDEIESTIQNPETSSSDAEMNVTGKPVEIAPTDDSDEDVQMEENGDVGMEDSQTNEDEEKAEERQLEKDGGKTTNSKTDTTETGIQKESSVLKRTEFETTEGKDKQDDQSKETSKDVNTQPNGKGQKKTEARSELRRSTRVVANTNVSYVEDEDGKDTPGSDSETCPPHTKKPRIAKAGNEPHADNQSTKEAQKKKIAVPKVIAKTDKAPVKLFTKTCPVSACDGVHFNRELELFVHWNINHDFNAVCYTCNKCQGVKSWPREPFIGHINKVRIYSYSASIID